MTRKACLKNFFEKTSDALIGDNTRGLSLLVRPRFRFRRSINFL